MNVFALLIAIDEYATMPLNGCVRDSQDVEEYLRHTIQPTQLQLQTLHNAQASKDNIINAFLQHLGQAKAGDAVFVHYSGHGSREDADPIFWDMCPDYKNEVMVTVDSLTADGYIFNPLADKELRWLIHQVAQKNPHIAIMMDCCHSGGGTRTLSQDVKSRFTGNRNTQSRSIDQFAFALPQYGAKMAQIIDPNSKRFILPNGQHIQLAGCRNNQTAKELIVNGEQRGIFTYSVLDILKNTGGNISYRDLVKLATTRVVNRVSDQVPQIDSVRANDDLNTFLLGGAKRNIQYYLLRNDATAGGWNIDAGSVHGIVLPTQGETIVGIIDPNADLNDNDAPILMRARVTDVQPSRSTVQFLDDTPNLEGYHARLLSAPLPPLRIRLLAEKINSAAQKEGIALLRTAIAKEKLFLSEVGECDDSDYWVYAYEHEGEQKYRITRQDVDRPVAKQQIGFNKNTAQKVAEELIQIARWHRVANLLNPNTLFYSPNNVKLELFEIIDDIERPIDTSRGEAILPYRYVNKEWVSPTIRIKLSNNTARRLFCTVLDLAANFEISDELFATKRLEPGESVYLFDGQTIEPMFDDNLAAMGVTEMRSLIKVFAATEEFDSSLFNLRGLETATAARNVATRNTFDALLQRAATRGSFNTKNLKPAVLSDWTTDQVNVCIVKPIAEFSQNQLEKEGISILPHKAPKEKAFKARKLGLSSIAQHRTRSIGNQTALALPDILLNDPLLSQPISFMSGRGGASALNILEMSEVENSESITPTTPLEIDLAVALKKNERIIPLALDADGLVYPIGFSRATRSVKTAGSANNNKQKLTRIVIGQLPKPQAAARGEAVERGIFNTIKIVFQKIVHETTGLFKYEYPYLAVVTRNQKGDLHYERNIAKVQQTLTNARKTVLITHGFTGETRDFFKPDRKQNDTPLLDLLQQHFDTVLAFDYDSYNTPIAQTAADLQSRLNECGYNANSGKKITLMAHSMGGLVSRYFIENLGGNAVVEHLVTIGTPHQGTMWVKVAEWAAMGLSLALSKLTVVGWPLTALMFLNDKLKIVKGYDKVSDDLRENSALVKLLNANAAPNGVRYTVIAGNTMLPEVHKGKVGQLLQRLNLPDHLQMVTKLFGENNDLVVAQSSMNKTGQTLPTTQEVPCDHISYFYTPQSLDAIKKAIGG
jgi:pimeloyl-ACP methyl ester carboxylesterase